MCSANLFFFLFRCCFWKALSRDRGRVSKDREVIKPQMEETLSSLLITSAIPMLALICHLCVFRESV